MTPCDVNDVQLFVSESVREACRSMRARRAAVRDEASADERRESVTGAFVLRSLD